MSREATPLMQEIEQEAQDKKKQADPLQDASLAVFRNLRALHTEMTTNSISMDELTDYLADIAGTKLTGFNIDRYAFECITQAIVTLFKE